MKCPVCGKYEFEKSGDFDICHECNWENDPVQDDDHNYAGGANLLSVNEARIEYLALNGSMAETAGIYKNTYQNRRKTIREKYRSLDRAAFPETAAEEITEYKQARQEYIGRLNTLNQTERQE